MAIKVFGITGTNGKTTVAFILRKILETNGKPCGLIGTIEHKIGDKKYASINTTPGAELLKEFFQQMTKEEIDYCVMEVSSHGLDQGRVKDIVIDYAGFTNLSQDHLDYHHSMEEYYMAKKKLFDQCVKGAVINLDDVSGRRLYQQLDGVTALNLVGYSLKDEEAYLFGEIESETISGSKIRIKENGEWIGKIKVPIPGKHFVYNALLAIGLARKAGIEFTKIKLAVEGLEPIPGRMELVGNADDTLGIIDYAHTPDALEKLLMTIGQYKRGRLICVFGCGGFRDKGKRKVMGEIAGIYSDYCIITNDNPRGEPPGNIIQAIEEGIYPTGCEYSIMPDRYRALKRAVILATKWDIIVVAGKGHEKYQIVGEEKLPFDDSKTLKELLEKKYEGTYDKSN